MLCKSMYVDIAISFEGRSRVLEETPTTSDFFPSSMKLVAA